MIIRHQVRKIKTMAFGTFDIFHQGHENFLKQAREYGNYLIVVIARDKTILKVKGKFPRNNEKERLQTIIKSGLANKIILGGLTDKYKIIKKYQPDIICLGYDQKAFTEKLKDKLKEYNLPNTKIARLKPYYPEKYKTSKISKIKN